MLCLRGPVRVYRVARRFGVPGLLARGDVFRPRTMRRVNHGIDLRAKQQHRRRDEEIEEQHHHPSQAAIGSAVIAEVLDVGRETGEATIQTTTALTEPGVT